MKYSVILLVFAILFVQCKRDESKQPEALEEQTAVSEAAGGGVVTFNPPDMADINFDEIVKLQISIVQNPTDKTMRQEFIGKAYYPSRAALVTVGIGLLKQPTTGQSISRTLAKRAAQLDAIRWASYGKSWIKNDLNPDFGSLDVTTQGMQTVLLSYEKGDSLYLAIANEVH